MESEHSNFTATILIHADGLVINRDTGEIYGYDCKPSAYLGRPDYQPELSRCRSVDDLSAFLKHVDRRKLPPYTLHSLIDAQDYAHGVWRRTDLDCRIKLPMMNTLSKLHGLVQYHNVIIMSQAELAKALGTVESNVMKRLNTLIDTNMLRVCTSREGNIRRGEIKLTINPRLVFRGDDYARERYMKDWYLNPVTKQPAFAKGSLIIAA